MIPPTFRRAATAVLLLVTGLGVLPVGSADAAGFTVTMSLPVVSGTNYGIGIDHVVINGTDTTGGYDQIFESPRSVCNNNLTIPSTNATISIAPPPNSGYTSVSKARLEIYQKTTVCGSSQQTLAGAVVTVSGPTNIGTVPMPTLGASNAGRFVGRVLSSSSVTSGRVSYSMFQKSGQPKTSGGVPVDAFTAGKTSGATYASNPLWNGAYIVFVTDNATGRKVTGIITLRGETTFDIDLDAPCFGIDECQFAGTVSTPAGAYHAISPVRLVNTRTNTGIVGALKPGDGRLADPNSLNRTAARLNHEFRVAGVGGLPTTGVSAVLATVTVSSGGAGGALRMFPKPWRTSYLADQSSFPAANGQPPVLWFGAGDVRTTTQLVKVGVGGRIRLDLVSPFAVHLTVDVIGWIDSGQAGQTGARVVAVQPARVFNSRNGIGTVARAFGGGEQRTAVVRDGVRIPSTASTVFGTLTSVDDGARGYDMAWASGGTRPPSIATSTAVGQVRSNFTAAPVGGDGAWTVQHNVGAGNLVVDTVGYVTEVAGSGGRTTARPAARVLNPTTIGSGAIVAVAVAGRGGVPASGARAVWVLVTVSSASSGSLAVFPSPSRLAVSNNQFVKGVPNATMTLVPVGSDGAIRISSSTTASVTVDIVGWVN